MANLYPKHLCLAALVWGFLLSGDRVRAEFDRGYMGLAPEEEFIFSDEEIVVSAARYEQRASECPSTIYVVTAEDIRRSGLTSIPEILRTVPGLDVMALGATDTQINPRGFNNAPSNKTLVMIDGLSFFDYVYSEVIWDFLPIVLDDIKRIEVVLGPGSALFGANAFSGLINIITKDPEEARRLHVLGSVGNGHSYHHSLVAGDTWQRLRCKISLSWDETDRWANQGEASDLFKCNTAIEYEPVDDMRIRLFAALVTGGTEFLVGPDMGFFNVEAERYFLTSLFHWKGLEVKQAYHRYPKTDFKPLPMAINFMDLSDEPVTGLALDVPALRDWFNTLFPALRAQLDANFFYEAYELQAQYGWDPTEWCKVTVGGDYRYFNVSSSLFQDDVPRLNEGSALLQTVLMPMDGLSLTLSGRYDQFQEIGGRTSYRGSLVYAFNQDHVARVSVGTAFRKPSYLENYVDMPVVFPVIDLVMENRGNPDLDPESITSLEAGYRGELLQGDIKAQITLFYNDVQDFIYLRVIDSVPLVGLPRMREYRNFGSARAWGGESLLEWRFSHAVKGSLGYALQVLTFTQDDPFTPENEDGMRIKASPLHKTNAAVEWELADGLSGRLAAYYVSSTLWDMNLSIPIKQKQDAYVLVNARLAYRFWNDRAEAAIAGYNLLHDKHQEYPVGDRIGSRVLLSWRMDF